MDITLRIRIELDAIRTEHLRRPPEMLRADLLERLESLREESIQERFPEFTAVALLRTTDILLDTGHPKEALESLAQAKTVLAVHNDHSRDIDLLVYQARGYALLQQWPEASDVCEEGINIIETFRRKVTPLGLQSAYLRFKIDLYEIGVRAAYELGKFELALSRAELAKCATARRLRSALDRPPPDQDSLSVEYRSVCQQLDRGDLTSTARAQLEAKRRTLWDILSIHRFRKRAASTTEDNADESYTQLRDDEALLYYFWTGSLELMIFGITNTGVKAKLRELSSDQREHIDRIPDAILNFRLGCGSLITPTPTHTALLLPPVIFDFLKEKKRWMISPHRVLHMLPFHALPVDDGYLIDRHPVGYVPNLHAALERHRPKLARALCAIGVPQIQDSRNTAQLITEISNAEEELNNIQKAYVHHDCLTQQLLGPKANTTLLHDLDRDGTLAGFSHIHIACHGTSVDSDSPLESKLVLWDADLDGLDIAGFHLNAEIAVLSACCSGQRPFHMPVVGDNGRRVELPGDEIFGLQAAFFAAGVHQIVSTLWPVDSDPAIKVTTAFHENLLMGMEADQALQESLLAYKRNATLFYRKVDKWAPFFLVSLSRPEQPHKEVMYND